MLLGKLLQRPVVLKLTSSGIHQGVDAALQGLLESQLLLVVGSSLMVYSGLRFVHAARAQGLPVAAINMGATRADGDFTLKHASPCGPALMALARALETACEPARSVN